MTADIPAKMKAAAYDGSPEIKLIEADMPQPGPKEALLKVHAAGICGTDLRILHSGHRRIPDGTMRILGHELSGEIAAVGSELDWPEVGMRASVAPNMGCGHCGECVQGSTQLCQNYFSFGVVIDGAFAEYMLLPQAAMDQGNLFEIPEGMSFEEAAVAEPLACAYHGYMACRPSPGERVLVVGVGPIGLMFVQLAKALGAGQVIVSSTNDARGRQAREYGADLSINPKKEDLEQAVLAATGGEGVDIAIVAAPSPEAQTQAVELLAYHGRLNFFGGLPVEHEMVPINANRVHYRELYLTGTTGSSVKEYRATMDLIARGRVDVASLISHRFPLSQAAEAVKFARSKQGLKTLILPHE